MVRAGPRQRVDRNNRMQSVEVAGPMTPSCDLVRSIGIVEEAQQSSRDSLWQADAGRSGEGGRRGSRLALAA
jgi:hypothetical protein